MQQNDYYYRFFKTNKEPLPQTHSSLNAGLIRHRGQRHQQGQGSDQEPQQAALLRPMPCFLVHTSSWLLLETEPLTPLKALAWSGPETTNSATAWDLFHLLCIIPKYKA